MNSNPLKKNTHMNTQKNLLLLNLSLLFTSALQCGDFSMSDNYAVTPTDFITIAAPASYDVASGFATAPANPLIISGTSSQPNMMVRLFINNTETSAAYTDQYGNWTIESSYLADGNYTLMAVLSTFDYQSLAMDTTTFTVQNPDFITIATPTEGSPIYVIPLLLTGTSSQPLSTVNISLDGSFLTTTTTDPNGNWQALSDASLLNGAHTFLVQLLPDEYDVTASSTVDVQSFIPLLFPGTTSQALIVEGDIPTSGSGSGPGYTYTVSGSTITINFTPAFPGTPSVQATGLRTAGSATVTLAAVSATALSISFSSGTQTVHFAASLLH